jgi:hypothetical protein
MTIQIKDLFVVKAIEASEMSAAHGGVGSTGLSGGKVTVSMSPEEFVQKVAIHDFVITKTVDVFSPK